MRSLMKKKQEETICKQFAATGSCRFEPRCRFSHKLPSAPVPPPPPTRQTPSASISETSTTAAAAAADWSPLDDGIAVNLPGASSDMPQSREEVNAYINGVLYGQATLRRRRRLPVFEEICPSDNN